MQRRSGRNRSSNPQPLTLLVTGFGPFLSFEDNPSARLAQECGERFEILEVAFKAVDDFIASLDASSFDGWLMLGLSSKAQKMHIEMVARNLIGETLDVRGEQHGPGPISPDAPQQLGSTLWKTPELLVETEGWATSVDAGSYLCNYLLYRGLEAFPTKQIGFLHVPHESQLPFTQSQQYLGEVLALITSCQS